MFLKSLCGRLPTHGFIWTYFLFAKFEKVVHWNSDIIVIWMEYNLVIENSFSHYSYVHQPSYQRYVLNKPCFDMNLDICIYSYYNALFQVHSSSEMYIIPKMYFFLAFFAEIMKWGNNIKCNTYCRHVVLFLIPTNDTDFLHVVDCVYCYTHVRPGKTIY